VLLVAAFCSAAAAQQAPQQQQPPATTPQQAPAATQAQPAPSAAGARILLLPRKIVSGEHATLAVLDVSGRLTPGVNVVFTNGDMVTTDISGRALFVAPLNARTIAASIEGRGGKSSSAILAPSEAPSATQEISAVPRAASLADRFEILGHGFCGDADANHVTIAGQAALVLASSPAYLAVLPPLDLQPGPGKVQVSCGQRVSAEFSVVFVSLELAANTATLAPKEHRTLTVRVRGSATKINLEARNLAPDVAELQGAPSSRAQSSSAPPPSGVPAAQPPSSSGAPAGSTAGKTSSASTAQKTSGDAVVRALSSGGVENVAHFELVGKQRGNFIISIRLLSPPSPPTP
jgi:hypothetical protein